MFDFKSWLIKGLVDGYKQGFFSMPHVTTMTANYIASGFLTNDDAENINAQCTEWDEEKAAQEAVEDAGGIEEEIPPDEVMA